MRFEIKRAVGPFELCIAGDVERCVWRIANSATIYNSPRAGRGSRISRVIIARDSCGPQLFRRGLKRTTFLPILNRRSCCGRSFPASSASPLWEIPGIDSAGQGGEAAERASPGLASMPDNRRIIVASAAS
jgi:hypothetical protein